MKKRIVWVILLSVLVCVTACSNNLEGKHDVISLFQRNKETFLQAAGSGDWNGVEQIRGIQSVHILETCVKIECGGAGLGPSTQYWGIFYSEEDDLSAADVAGPRDQLVVHGNGYLYQENGGDNRYYVEALGDHFYYYEAYF